MQFWDELTSPIKRITCLAKYQVDPQTFSFVVETADGSKYETCATSHALFLGGIYYGDPVAGIVFLKDDIVTAPILHALVNGMDKPGHDIEIVDAKLADKILTAHGREPVELKAECRL